MRRRLLARGWAWRLVGRAAWRLARWRWARRVIWALLRRRARDAWRGGPRFAWIVAVAALAGAGAARADLVRLAPDAHVRSVSYRFIGPHELTAWYLSSQVATHAPGGLNSLKRAFGWLPLVPDEEKVPFSPLTLQEDLARLRRFYARQGFPEAALDYDVRTDKHRRRVQVTFAIREGRPIRLRSVDVVNPDSAATWAADPELAAEGRRAAQQLGEKNRGIRFGAAEARAIQASATAWLGDHGYLSPTVETATVVDSAQLLVDLKLRITPGPRARIAHVNVQGVHSVPEPIVTRNLPFTAGDWVSTGALAKGQQNLQSVDLFRSATVVMPESLRSESEVPVDVTISEAQARFTGVQLGYVTDGAGVSAQGRWTHPNFTGGARSLNVVALVQTGWGNLGTVPDRLARLTLTLRQPYVGNPNLSLSFGPKGELRDDQVERSALGSGIVTLVYQHNPLQSTALTYDFTVKNLLDLRFGGISVEDTDLGGYLPADVVDAVKGLQRTSQLILSINRGRLDQISMPRHGIVIKPTLAATTPNEWSDLHFLRGDVLCTTFLPVPVGSSALMLRGIAGRLWPFGSSVPAPGDDGEVDFLALRDQTFTAGGSGDVRGYDTGLLGPKIPLLDDVIQGQPITAKNYQPVGGLERIAATAELRLPIPGAIPQINAHFFLDGGRVWNSDSRYQIHLLTDDETRWFYATGGGVGYYSPVGAIRLEGGYMLNPSILDLRDPNDVLRAIAAGQPVESAPEHPSRRFRVHLSLGLWF